MDKWICNNCKCTEFHELYISGCRKFERYNQKGIPIYQTVTYDEFESIVECEKCGNSGKEIKDIASFIKEEEE